MTPEPIALHPNEGNPTDDRSEADTLRIIDGGNTEPTAGPQADEISSKTLRDEDRDDDQNPDAALLDHPEWDVSAMLSAATFDTVVPSAVLAARSTIYQTMNFQGLFSLDPYSLTEFFKQQLGEIGDDGKPKDEDDNLSLYADMAEDHKRELREQIESDRAATLSEAQIDAIPWVGDPDEIYTSDNISVSRKAWLAGAKAARTKITQKVANGEMTEAEAAHDTRLISDYEIAMREHRYEDAERAKQALPEPARQLLDQAAKTAGAADPRVSYGSAYRAGSAAQAVADSTEAGASVLSQMAEPSAMLAEHGNWAEQPTTAKRETALSNPPSIELTEEFSVAAAPHLREAEPEPRAVELSQAAKPAALPTLSQNFDI